MPKLTTGKLAGVPMPPPSTEPDEHAIDAWVERLLAALDDAKRPPPRAGIWVSEADTGLLLGCSPDAMRMRRAAGDEPRPFELRRRRYEYDIQDIARHILARRR